MHELAHYLLEHFTQPLFGELPLFQRNCTPGQEKEANFLAYTILLPRPMIVNYAMRSIGHVKIMEDTGLSLELVRYRINISGVPQQYKRWQPFH